MEVNRDPGLPPCRPPNEGLLGRMRASVISALQHSRMILLGPFRRLRDLLQGASEDHSREQEESLRRRVQRHTLEHAARTVVEGARSSEAAQDLGASNIEPPPVRQSRRCRRISRFFNRHFHDPILGPLACGILVSAIATGLSAVFAPILLYVASTFLALLLITYIVIQGIRKAVKLETGQTVGEWAAQGAHMVQDARSAVHSTAATVQAVQGSVEQVRGGAQLVVSGVGYVGEQLGNAFSACAAAAVAVSSSIFGPLVSNSSSSVEDSGEGSQSMGPGDPSLETVFEEDVPLNEPPSAESTIFALPNTMANQLWSGMNALVDMGRGFLSSSEGASLVEDLCDIAEEEEFFEAQESDLERRGSVNSLERLEEESDLFVDASDGRDFEPEPETVLSNIVSGTTEHAYQLLQKKFPEEEDSS